MAPFDGRPPNVLVLGGGELLGEASMTGVLAGYEDATGADVRRCRRFVGTSAGSIVASSLVAGRSPRRPGRPRPMPSAQSRTPVVPPRRSRAPIGRDDRCRTSPPAPERSPPGSARRSARSRCGSSRKGGGRSRPSGTRSTAGRHVRRAPARVHRRRRQRSPRRVRQPVGAPGLSRAGGCGVLRDPGGLRAGAQR